MTARPLAAGGLVVTSAGLAAAGWTYRLAFHRAVTFRHVQPVWPGLVLPAAAVACVGIVVAVRLLARRHGCLLGGIAWTLAAVPIGLTAAVTYDHVTNGPHNGDTGAGRLHQIGLGLMLYAMDHGHALPPDLPTLARAVRLPQSAFVGCESDATTTDGADPDRVAELVRSPTYNGFTYVGGGLRDDADPLTVVAFSRAISGSDGGYVLYADGHVDWVTGEPARAVADRSRPATGGGSVRSHARSRAASEPQSRSQAGG